MNSFVELEIAVTLFWNLNIDRETTGKSNDLQNSIVPQLSSAKRVRIRYYRMLILPHISLNSYNWALR
jgi:hypothetical protein